MKLPVSRKAAGGPAAASRVRPGGVEVGRHLDPGMRPRGSHPPALSVPLAGIGSWGSGNAVRRTRIPRRASRIWSRSMGIQFPEPRISCRTVGTALLVYLKREAGD